MRSLRYATEKPVLKTVYIGFSSHALKNIFIRNQLFVLTFYEMLLLFFRDEQAKLNSILGETFGSFFIGLQYFPVTSSYGWVNGDPLNSAIDAWDHYQPGTFS